LRYESALKADGNETSRMENQLLLPAQIRKLVDNDVDASYLMTAPIVQTGWLKGRAIGLRRNEDVMARLRVLADADERFGRWIASW
jgi:hypothetical protein